MVYCINAELAFATAAANDLIFANLVAGITSPLRFGAEQFQKAATRFGPNGIYIIMRFRDRDDATAFRDLIEAQALVRAPRPGSFYRIHDCSHDGQGSCTAGTRREW
jgi:hypothetical protein